MTDLAILELTGSTITYEGDFAIVRTPANPNYHWGNSIMVLDPAAVNNARRWVELFKANFPLADWTAIDLPLMPTDVACWSELGLQLEQLDVMTSNSAPKQTELPEGYAVRMFTPSDWNDLIVAELEENLSSGVYEPVSHEKFVRQTNDARKALCSTGKAAWFGVICNDELVASLGIVKCGSTARYQAVATNENHRRLGLASHLLGLAAQWSIDQGCDNWVIATEENNSAAGVYRRAGFVPAEPSFSAYKKP
jgi:GNAT superfamily N-acetyltransferase